MALGDTFQKQWLTLKETGKLIVGKENQWNRLRAEFKAKLAKTIETTIMLKSIVNSIFAVFNNANFIVLFPRMDFKGLGYYPQLFFIKPTGGELVTTTLSSNTSDKPIINMQNRKMEYASYNIVTQPLELHFNKAFLTRLDKQVTDLIKLADTAIGHSFFSALLQHDVNIIRHQLNERVASGVYFSVYSPAIGFHESAIVSNLTTTNTRYYNRIHVSLTVKVLKTFNIENYKDFSYADFYKA